MFRFIENAAIRNAVAESLRRQGYYVHVGSSSVLSTNAPENVVSEAIVSVLGVKAADIVANPIGEMRAES